MDPDRRNLLDRREIVAAYVRALERPEDLLRVCAAAAGGRDNALSAVARAFDVSAIAAMAILDLQVRRFTPEETERIRFELADVDRLLAADADG